MLIFHLLCLSFFVTCNATLSTYRHWPIRRNNDDAPLREAFIELRADFRNRKVSDRRGIANFDPQKYATWATHPVLVIVGDGFSNGNLKIELSLAYTGDWSATVVDNGPYRSMEDPKSRFEGKTYVKVKSLGNVLLNNKDLLDVTTGKGIVTDVWSRNPDYKIDTHNSLDFMNDLIKELKLDPGEDFSRYYESSQAKLETKSVANRDFVKKENVPVLGVTYTDSVNVNARRGYTFDVAKQGEPKLLNLNSPFAIPKDLQSVNDFPTGGEFMVREPSGVLVRVKTFGDLEEMFEEERQRAEIAAEKGDRDSVYLADEAADMATIEEQATDPNKNTANFEDEKVEISSSDGSHSSSGSDSGSDTASDGSSTTDRTNTRHSLEIEGPAELAVVQSRGVAYTIASIAKTSLLDIGGIAATAVVPVFVILDIINGDWRAAVLGAVSGIAGIGAFFLGSGPIGLFVGAACAILFAILPGIFNAKPSPQTNNPSKILQWSFFGDADHTGNEACNKERKKHSLAENCTALYGAGTISNVLNMNIFDASVLLINYNDGLPISILDMSSHFPVRDYTLPNWTSNQTSYIDCGVGPTIPSPPGYNGGPLPGFRGGTQPPSAPYKCEKPKYILNRTMITLPQIGVTADKVYNRLIPAPGGDCKLYSTPIDGDNVPFFDVKITGRPVGVQCNLTLDSPIGLDASLNYFSTNPDMTKNITQYTPGTQLVYSPSTNISTNVTLFTTNGTNHVPTNLMTSQTKSVSTDNSTLRAYRTPPPPVAFLEYNSTNSVCLGTASATIVCLPNGTYPTGDQPQKLSYVQPATSVTFPPSASSNSTDRITWSYPAVFDQLNTGQYSSSASAGDEQQMNTAIFSGNVTKASPSADQAAFKQGIGNLIAGPKQFDVLLAKSWPGLCIYTGKSYTGSVQCFGLGANNITSPVGGWAKSIAFKSGANAWIYSGFYGDLTGVFLNTDVPDLSAVPDGSQRSFQDRIAGMWVSLPL